jgi:8-oxo-dGTP pyrophosphatase MutT (NUDIX family)
MTMQPSDSFSYYDQQAKVIAAAGVVLCSADDAVLLVKPTYKTVWHLPGGILEPGETPREAARREVREEIGLDVVVGRLLSVDFKSPNADRPGGVQFVFDGGTLTIDQISRVRIDFTEIDDWRSVSFEDAVDLVEPGGPATRMGHTLAALVSGRTVYLEDGDIP